MDDGLWLSLTDYSNKHQVSVSTLRRKIKSGQIEHRLQDGRYVIFEAPNMSSSPSLAFKGMGDTLPADQLLQEIKRAYKNSLHEKEEQILDLKEEITDLKTLVLALENDNQRLRRKVGETF